MTTPATTPDPREDKLPVWAQRGLDQLRRALRDAESVRDDAVHATSPETSDAVQRTSRMHDTFVGLGAGLNGQVTYLLDGPGRFEHGSRQVTVRQQHSLLYVMGSELLTVHPQSGNTILLDVVARRGHR